MKLTNLLTTIALLVGASASSALANGESIPRRDPGQRPIAQRDCSEPFASAMYDECAGMTPTPTPTPTRRLTPPPPPTVSPISPPPPSECGSFQVTLTAVQVFPELAGNLERAAADLAALRRQLDAVQRSHQTAAAWVYRLAPVEGMPFDPVAFDAAQRRLDAAANAELALGRQITEIERYRDQTARYLASVGTQIVRDHGCISLDRAIGIVRARFGAPRL